MVHSDADHAEVLIKSATDTGGNPQIAGENGELLINTGTVVPRHTRTVSGAMAALISWFFIITGTNTIGATGNVAQISGGAGSVIADGATAVNTNSAGAVNATGTLAQPWRTAGGAFSDEMPIPWASRFVFKTGTDTINAHRGAQIAGGAGSVIATGAATVKTNSAGAVNTTGTVAHFPRTAGGAFRDQMHIPRQFTFESGTGATRTSVIAITAQPGSTITFGPAPGPSLPMELLPSTPTVLP